MSITRGYIDGGIDPPIELRCLHCDKVFMSNEGKFEKRGEPQPLFWCPDPDCDGAGVGYDLWPSDHAIFKQEGGAE